MAVECDGDFGVDAAPAVSFGAVADLERWPEWARDLERVEILSRDGDGRPGRVRMVADLFGKEFDATVDFHYDLAPGELRFTLVEARKLTSLEGTFRFEPQSDGTSVGYRFRLELLKPKALRIERMVSRKIDTYLSRDLRRRIERNFAPSLEITLDGRYATCKSLNYAPRRKPVQSAKGETMATTFVQTLRDETLRIEVGSQVLSRLAVENVELSSLSQMSRAVRQSVIERLAAEPVTRMPGPNRLEMCDVHLPDAA